jgi:opacity protein-like surface antigen
MKFVKIIVITIFLSTLIYCQNDSAENSYNSTSGITLSLFLPLTYSIGYDFVVNSRSTISTSVCFAKSSSDRWDIVSAMLENGKYNVWADSYSDYRVGVSFYYLYDIYKYSQSKFYAGAGTKIEYGESEYNYSRKLELVNIDEQGSMTNFQDHKRLSLDFIFGYEYLITDNVKIFGQVIGYLLWDNTKQNITDGWNLNNVDLTDLENTGLSQVKTEVKKTLTNSMESDFRIGVIFSL